MKVTAHQVRICALEELAEGRAATFRLDDRDIILARDGENIYALDNICSHDGGRLGESPIIAGQLECPRHGARFDIQTGAATRMPAVAGIKSYPVTIENGDVLVEIEEEI